jgi:hypothetical protein
MNPNFFINDLENIKIKLGGPKATEQVWVLRHSVERKLAVLEL